MKIVHSFWSKPILRTSGTKNNLVGGWPNKKYLLMSWTLSCLTFKRVYDEIELMTDTKGKKLLIDDLGLPYDDVKIELDCLNNYASNLWALGKLYTYAKQDKPFIHVDGDVFIWERFSSRIEQAELIGQHVDVDSNDYNFSLGLLKNYGAVLPQIIKGDLLAHDRLRATNAGIIGGNNIGFFKDFAEKAFRFVNSNMKNVDSSIIGSSYALIYEQLLYGALARSKKIQIQHYVEENELVTMDLTDFMRKYQSNYKYVHLFGDAKTKFEYCRELEMQLLVEFPEYHAKIIKLINDERQQS